MADPTFVTLGGEQHAVVLPDLTAMDELLLTHRQARGLTALRALSAMLGLCTRIGRRSAEATATAGIDDADLAKRIAASVSAQTAYQEAGYHVLRYGGTVYAYLRGQGAQISDIVDAAKPLIPLLEAACYPTVAEVAVAVGKSEASAVA